MVSFINRLGTMVILFMSVYLTTILKFSLEETAFILSAFGIGSIVGAFLGGYVGDWLGERIVITLSLLIGGIFLIMLQWATGFWELFFVIFGAAAIGEAYRPALMSLVGKTVPKHQTSRTMALIRLAINLGFTAAPVIGGFVAVSIGYDYLFWIDGLTCISAAIFFSLVSRNWPTKKVVSESNKNKGIQEETLSPFRNASFLAIVFMNLFVAICFIQWFNSIPVFLKTEWSFNERVFGLIMMVNGGLIFLFEMPLVHYLEKKNKVRSAMIAGLAFMVISFIPFLMYPSLIWAYVAVVLVTIGEILVFPFASSTAIDVSTPGNRGQYMSIYSMSWSITKVFAPGGLALIAIIGYDSFWLLLTALSAFSLFLCLRIKKQVFDKNDSVVP